MAERRPKNLTLGGLLDEMADLRGDGEAMVWQERRISYAGWRDQTDQFARALLSLGVKPGDRVGLLAANRPEWLIAAFAINKIGATATAISTFSTPRELAWTLKHSGAVALVTISSVRGRLFLDALRTLCPEISTATPGSLSTEALPDLRAVISIDTPSEGAIIGWEDFLTCGDAIPVSALANAQSTVTPDDICFILYTSGSTADPKGVTLTHRHLISNGFDIGERQHLTADDRLWFAVPLFWSFGSSNAMPAIVTHGGCMVLHESFEAGEALDLIEQEHCSVFYGMANMARAIGEHPSWSTARVASMRTGLTIGLPEDVELIINTLGAAELCNVYGSTETYGNATVCDAKDPLELRLYSQGLPLPGMKMRAVDPETHTVLPDGEVGELAVAGYVTPGYFKAPEQTAAAFDADGYFLTGDLGMIGTDGRLRYRGRLKEIIKTGGVNVAPIEVEEVLVQHPAVKQAYVVGIPDPTKDEIVAAAVELEAGVEVDVPALIAHCRAQLASYKVPSHIAFRTTEQFPRTPTGKIHKPGLKEELAREISGA
ncbi:MAG: AMP-binding protein [Proteobacteria bacterium]|nr:AMP-binding protein [Pseudomonadota bacterium]MDA1311589.1 AMP-binding protein [Pseudomonadota bacterium]